MTTAAFIHRLEESRREELITHQLVLRQLMRAVVHGPGAGVDTLLDLRRFHDYFASMVLFEESLMSQSGYPDLEDHHHQHETLVRDLEDILHSETTTDHAEIRIGAFLARLRIHLYRSDGLFAHHLLAREGIGRAAFL